MKIKKYAHKIKQKGNENYLPISKKDAFTCNFFQCVPEKHCVCNT